MRRTATDGDEMIVYYFYIQINRSEAVVELDITGTEDRVRLVHVVIAEVVSVLRNSDLLIL